MGEVHGFVFTSADLSAHWRRLDELEGDDYVRVLVPTRLASGASVDAYIYAFARSPSVLSDGS
ncbi:MAG: gamma-glutamylcyclotransferase [Blastocatellales bacterium]